jgi:orotate phosphoribosyltransferase
VNLTLDELTACGAHQKGHFLLSSGLHSGDDLQCALYLAHPRRAARAGGLLADAVSAAQLDPQIIIAPAMGGLIIGHETARALNLPFLFTERSEGTMVLRRGFGVAPGQRVMVMIGVASMINRSGDNQPFAPLPSRSLLDVDFPTWTADECPLCRDGVPTAKPGSRPVA